MALFDVIKCEAPAHTLVWRHPAEDFNTMSTLIVDESQAAIFYKNGQVADVFTGGRYVLSTQNIPLLRKLIELPTGGVSSFSCKVYFVNLVEAMNLKWGLNSKVSYIEPTYQIPISIGARGAMSIQIGNPAYLLTNLLGTEHGITAEELTDYFRSLIVMRAKSYLTKIIIEQQISIFTIDGELELLAEAMKARIAPDLDKYGIKLKLFTVDEVIKPEDDPLFLRVKRSLSERSTGLFEAETKRQAARIAAQAGAETEVIGAQGHRAALDTLGTSYQQERQFDISETMAANPGAGGFAGLAGAMAMIPGAVAMGNMTAGAVNLAVNTANTANAAGAVFTESTPNAVNTANTAGTASAANTVDASGTANAVNTVDASSTANAANTVDASGTANTTNTVDASSTANAANTMNVAGTVNIASTPVGAGAVLAGTKKCKSCGTELPRGAKFCFQCGQPQPKFCPNCGKELPEDAKFCFECGTKL